MRSTVGIERKLDTLASIAIIIVSILLGIKLLAPRTPQLPPPDIGRGSKVTAANLNWTGSDRTLLIVMQVGCRFCTASAPFYREIVEKARSESLHIAVLAPQDAADTRRYLQMIGVPIDDVRQAALDAVHVRGTPTMILVDRSGAVVDSWRGQIPIDQQQSVLKRITGSGG